MYREQKQMSLGLGNTNGAEWYKLRSNCIQRMLRPREVSHHLPSVDTTAGIFIREGSFLKPLGLDFSNKYIRVH